MSDIEIDRALALAIGWTENRIGDDGLPDPDVAIFGFGVGHHRSEPDEVKCWDGDMWRTFSHKDWSIIGPIAARYNMFPYKLRGIECHAGWNVLSSGCDFTDAVPQRAIAMAVIQGAKK